MATPKWYANGLLNVATGAVSLDGDTIKLILITASYTPNQSTDTFRSDLGANEATGATGYPAGGFTLATKTLTIVSALTIQWDADDITQSITGSLTFRYGVYYKSRGGASSADELIGYVDFGSQTITSATLTITQADPLTITAS